MKNFYIILFFLVATSAYAHGLSTEKKVVVGNYQLQMEYDTIGDVSAGETTSFNFELLNPKTEEGIDFDRVFVQFLKKVGDYPLIFSSNLTPLKRGESLSANATVFVPVAGTYLAKLSYYKGERELATTTIEFGASATQNEKTNLNFGSFKYLSLVTLAIGFALGYIVHKRTV